MGATLFSRPYVVMPHGAVKKGSRRRKVPPGGGGGGEGRSREAPWEHKKKKKDYTRISAGGQIGVATASERGRSGRREVIGGKGNGRGAGRKRCTRREPDGRPRVPCCRVKGGALNSFFTRVMQKKRCGGVET